MPQIWTIFPKTSDPYQLHNLAFEKDKRWIDEENKQILLDRLEQLSNCKGSNDCNNPVFEPSRGLNIPSRLFEDNPQVSKTKSLP